jgi:SNF2 family DNA or RNA helicase
VLNPQVAGVGLNITAANHVIHFSPEWNPAKTDQASARAFRQGQHLPVTVHHFAYEGTIEEKVIDRARLRREIAEEAAPGSSDEPTADDLLQLFEIVAEGRLT